MLIYRPGDSVTNEISEHRADIGLAGMYVTSERNLVQEMTAAHSLDCAAFLTLSSRALPRFEIIKILNRSLTFF